MAPRRQLSSRTKAHRSKAKNESSAPPDPYQSLVAEYLATEESSPADTADEDARSSKRRRVDANTTESEDGMSLEDEDNLKSGSKQQYAYNDSEDDATSEFSDADFEDVVLSDAPRSVASLNRTGDLNLTLGGEKVESQKRLSAGRRKALTAADRKMRLEIHKTHVLALLGHGRLRNKWCNDTKVQGALRGILPASVRKMFKDDTTQTQWQRSRSLKMGLEKASEIFKDQYHITTRGMARSYWSESISSEQIDTIPEDIDLPIELEDFQKLAAKRKGSRDVGAQLFCALLRSIGLDVRLVYSLQPLSIQATFRPTSSTRPTPVVVPFLDNRTSTLPGQSTTGSYASAGDGSNSVPQGVRRFGHATKKTDSKSTKVPQKQRIHESAFPVYWVEVFNIADQKWVPVDPLVLKLVDKPSKYEPPANDAENSMSYVVAIDEDGYVKDVTRRYAHAYNAKTRRNRVEGSKDGHEWWERIMGIHHDPLPQDRDQVEDAELTAREARELMPRNIVEFKNHPYYALERHLRKNEVLQPRRQVGTVSSGSNKSVEAVYRRNDVHTVRSADAWFRKGRQVKFDEMPLKHLEPKKIQGQRTNANESDEETEIPGVHAGTPLFAIHQTQQYTPPPIINGIVPKNIYGNIDVYTSWMVPAGGVWINHPFAIGAAKLLLIDWADAVTGFEFRGRTGTAIIKGIVVAGEYHEAVVETIKGLQYAIEQEELYQRSIQVLQTWKRFLIALRIRERIKGYYVEGEELEEATRQKSESEYSDTDNSEDDGESGGGFLRGAYQDASDAEPSVLRAAHHEVQQDSEPLPKALEDAMAPILSTWGELLPTPPAIHITSFPNLDPSNEYMDASGGFLPEDTVFPEQESGGFMIDSGEPEEGGGFLPDAGQDTYESGGFIPPMSEAEQHDNTEKQADTQGQIPRFSNPPSAHSDVEIDNTKQDALSKPTLVHSESAASGKSFGSSKSVGSLLSHDPEDDDAEPGWI